MDILPILQGYAIAQGSHTGGHFDEAGNQGIPISLHAREFAEHWNQPDIKKNIDMDGAGFRMQDQVVNAGNNREAHLISAIIKALYLAGVPKMLGGDSMRGGDIEEVKDHSGNRYTPHMLGATAISDLAGYNNPDRNWSLGFSTFGTGQPGLIYTHRF